MTSSGEVVQAAGQPSRLRRIRRLEFGDLPKTISGKIRRVELRGQETSRAASARGTTEFWEEDFTW